LGCGSDRTQNIQFGAARASRLGDQVAAPNDRRVRARPKPCRQSRYVTRLPAILAELRRTVHR
jgi:hypothetical protein